MDYENAASFFMISSNNPIELFLSLYKFETFSFWTRLIKVVINSSSFQLCLKLIDCYCLSMFGVFLYNEIDFCYFLLESPYCIHFSIDFFTLSFSLETLSSLCVALSLKYKITTIDSIVIILCGNIFDTGSVCRIRVMGFDICSVTYVIKYFTTFNNIRAVG